MKLYLVQHGEALPKEENPDRPLSAKGREDVQQLAAFLGKAGVSVTYIMHSGKSRARESAKLLAAAIAPDGRADPIPGLAPKDPVDAIIARIADWQGDTALVGHLPFMSRLVSRLITGDEANGIAAFRPGSMICLERGETGSWAVNWFLRPELFA